MSRMAVGLGAVAAAVLSCGVSVADAQSFPSKPITIVVLYVPGAMADTTMRLIAQKVSDSVGQPVRIDNRAGGGGVIGSMVVKQAAPDGYTLLEANISSHAANASLFSKLPYDPIKDFKPITVLWSYPSFLVVPGGSPARSVSDLAVLAGSKAGGLTFVSQGIGTGGHLLGAMFSSRVGLPMVHVPYKGAAPAMMDLIANRADFFFTSYASADPYLKDGRLRALAIASPSRLKRYPDIPTMAESGFPDVEYDTWFGLIAPARTPDSVVQTLNDEFTKAVRSPELVKRLAEEGLEVTTTTPAEFTELIVRDTAKVRKMIKESGAKSE